MSDMKKLESLRAELDAKKAEWNRLNGELSGHKSRLEELEKKCREDFDCSPDELPGVVEAMNNEAARLLVEAEAALKPQGVSV